MRDSNQIGADLKAWMTRRRLTESALAKRINDEAKGINVSQSWLSRIIAGRFRRITPVIRHVADYANIPVTEETEPDGKGTLVIDEAISAVWNGSLAHATLIARLIKVADGISPPELPGVGKKKIDVTESVRHHKDQRRARGKTHRRCR